MSKSSALGGSDAPAGAIQDQIQCPADDNLFGDEEEFNLNEFFNVERLFDPEGMYGGDDSILKMSLQMFIRHNLAVTQEGRGKKYGLIFDIFEAYKKRHFLNLKISSHSLKGSSKYMELEKLADICFSLQKAAEVQDIVHIEEDIQKLVQYVPRLYRFLCVYAEALDLYDPYLFRFPKMTILDNCDVLPVTDQTRFYTTTQIVAPQALDALNRSIKSLDNSERAKSNQSKILCAIF